MDKDFTLSELLENVLEIFSEALSEPAGLFILVVALILLRRLIFDYKRRTRRKYYRNVYLKSDAWKRKRYVVLKRDNWTCVYCGARATQVHHKRYAKRKIGKEPIKWLVSVCKPCHDRLH